MDLSITRVAITRPEDAAVVVAEAGDGQGTGGKVTEMGRKALVPYGLYRCSIFVSPQQAERTGFDGEDLGILWDALVRMWDFDRSASRGLMACRGLYAFTHDNPFGNAPAHKLLDLVTATSREGVVAPRSFKDYDVTAPAAGLLEAFPGVTLTRLEG